MKNTGRRIQGMQTDILKAQQTTNEYEKFGNTTLFKDGKNLKYTIRTKTNQPNNVGFFISNDVAQHGHI